MPESERCAEPIHCHLTTAAPAVLRSSLQWLRTVAFALDDFCDALHSDVVTILRKHEPSPYLPPSAATLARSLARSKKHAQCLADTTLAVAAEKLQVICERLRDGLRADLLTRADTPLQSAFLAAMGITQTPEMRTVAEVAAAELRVKVVAATKMLERRLHLDKPNGKRPRRRTLPKERKLTAREVEVMKLVGDHKGNISAAARELGKDYSTVREQYNNALAKVGRKSKEVFKESTKRLPTDSRGQTNIFATPEPERDLDQPVSKGIE